MAIDSAATGYCNVNMQRARHEWIWLAPEKIEDTEGFVEVANLNVPFSQASISDFVVDGEYDPTEFSMWAESIWHFAVVAKLEYLQSVFDDLLANGPDIDVEGFGAL